MKYVLLIILISFTLNVHSQIKQDTSEKIQNTPEKIKILALPLIFRSPETWWAAGLTGSISFKTSPNTDTLTRTSNIRVVGMYTERKQNVEAIDGTIFFPKENYVLYFQTSHSFFPDKYWGLGPNTSDSYEQYRFEQIYFTAHLKKKLSRNVFIGVLNEFQDLFNMKYDLNGGFAHDSIFGKAGYIVSALGGSCTYDTRNSGFWPTKGVYFQTTFTYFNTYIGSKYNNLKTVIDLRYYKKLFRDHILASQFYSYSNSGQTPYRELAMLGGSENLRGFYQGRYRDNSMITVITEYRAPVHKRFAICVFGGMGNVYNELEDLQRIARNIKYAYGGGLRFSILKHERLNLRLDYGYYNKFNQGLYFTMGECF